MKHRKLIYDFIRACLEFADWLWLHHWRCALLGMVLLVALVWWRAVGYA